MTLVHKNTVFKLGCGMFVEECHRVAKEFPDVTVDEVIVDTMAMRLIRDPQSFDVIVTTNMFGDILTDEAAGLVGGLGMAPGLCIGEGNLAMAQATHGSAPDIAGKGIANPFAMIESARMMIEWLGHNRKIPQAVEAASIMESAIAAALGNPATRTRDIKGTADTAGMTRGHLGSNRLTLSWTFRCPPITNRDRAADNCLRPARIRLLAVEESSKTHHRRDPAVVQRGSGPVGIAQPRRSGAQGLHASSGSK